MSEEVEVFQPPQIPKPPSPVASSQDSRHSETQESSTFANLEPVLPEPFDDSRSYVAWAHSESTPASPEQNFAVPEEPIDEFKLAEDESLTNAEQEVFEHSSEENIGVDSEPNDEDVEEAKFEVKEQVVEMNVTVVKKRRTKTEFASREDEQGSTDVETGEMLNFAVEKVANAENPYRCLSCGKTFKQLRYFKCHAVSIHTGIPCEKCGKTFIGRFRFRRHVLTEHGASSLRELKASTVCENVEGGSLVDSSWSSAQQPCVKPPDGVEKVVKKLKKKRVKKQVVEPESVVVKKEAEPVPVVVSTPVPRPPPVFTCANCPETFATAAKLNWHLEERHARLKLVCRICSVSFSHKMLLNRHYTTVHSGSEYALGVYTGTSCKICGKVVRNMTLHRAIHAVNKPWKCNVCGRGFAHKCNLQVS
jgi:DNA-directed RNA polymerase subunit RPC12/RpoP